MILCPFYAGCGTSPR